jgi:hypothetical protein
MALGGPVRWSESFQDTADGSEKSLESSAVPLFAADSPRDASRRAADGLEKSLQASAVDRFADFLRLLEEEGFEYAVVGGMAVAAYAHTDGCPRPPR